MARGLSTPYLRDPDIRAMVARLRHGPIADWKVDALARAVHKLVGWAGTPVAWDDEGKYWGEAGRQRGLAEARRVLEEGLPE